MRLPLLISFLVVPGLACELEPRPDSSTSASNTATAGKRAVAPKPPENTGTDAGADTNAELEKELEQTLQTVLDRLPDSGVPIPFGSGMTRPERISGEVPGYTPEALAARVEGTLIFRCVIWVSGEVTECRVIRPLLHLDEAFLRAAKSWRFKPATYKGHPVSVNYTFTFKMELPEKNG